MPQDPDLYGQRAPKRQKKEMALSSSIAFTSQLNSLISKPTSSANPSSSPSAARPRPSKSKTDVFANVKAKRKDDGSAPRDSSGGSGGRLVLKSPGGTEDDKREEARARRKMEAKARLYAAMKRGDYVPREGEAASLVDFDRKWAEKHPSADGGGLVSSSSSSEDEDEGGNNDTEVVEYEDEYGRLRRGTRADKLRMERRLRSKELGTAELERMSARPKAPEKIIYGDAVQSAAFVPADEAAMEALARKRDRSATPPELQHYDAEREIRTKGVAFYQFSKGEEERQAQMQGLDVERLNTERARRERDDQKEMRRREMEQRKREIETRRQQIGEKRAKKLADSFLEGLAVDIGDTKTGTDGSEKAGSELQA